MNTKLVSLLVTIPTFLRTSVRIEAARSELTITAFVRRALEAAVTNSMISGVPE